MRRLLIYLVPVFILSGCVQNSSGESELSAIGYLIIIGISAIVIKVAYDNKENKIKTDHVLKKSGLCIKDFIPGGKYVGGHPECNEEIDRLAFRSDGEALLFYQMPEDGAMPREMFSIPIEAIEDITLEDASTIEHKITVGRMLLVGVFAIAWKKKKKNEVAFVRIEWKQDRFSHETLFCYEEDKAMHLANEYRNRLIRVLKEDDPDNFSR